MRACDAHGNNVLPRLRKARAVLAIVALTAPRPVLRSRLCELLWSQTGPAHARVSLRMAVRELKAALGPAADLLHSGRWDIALRDSELRIDARHPGRAEPAALARGAPCSETFLADLADLDPAFDRWLRQQRRDMARRARDAAEADLAQAHGAAEAIAAAEHLLNHDPTHEGAWRALIRAHVARGDRAAAVTALDRCRTMLSRHLQLDPSPETTALAGDLSALTAARTAAPGDDARCMGSGARASRTRVRVGVANLHDDGDARVAEGAAVLTAELIEALARFRWIRSVPCPIAGADYDIDFLLTGTVRRLGGRPRVSLNLLDQRAGGIVVWADRYGKEIDDVVAAGGRIAGTTAARIEARLWLWEGQRGGADNAAMGSPGDLVRLATPLVNRLDRAGFMTAGRWLSRAVELDPNDAEAHACFLQWCLKYVGQGWAVNPSASVQLARHLARRTIQLDPEDARGLTLAGHVLAFLDHRPEEALRLHERAIAANANLPLSWCLSGLAESYIGDTAEGVRRIRHAQALSPGDPHDFFSEGALCISNLLGERYEAAAAAGRRAVALNPGFSSSHKSYLAAMGQLGRGAEAASSLTTLRNLEPGFSVEQALSRSPFATTAGRALYAEGLLIAGLPRTA
jgi:DNA-binding SARP family transcriptional activator